jgi:hypothetical protein
MRSPPQQREHTCQSHRCEGRDRSLGRPRREHKFEEGKSIAKAPLERPEGTISATNHQANSLGGQHDHRSRKQSISTARERASPHITEASELDQGDRGVTKAEGTRPGIKSRRFDCRRGHAIYLQVQHSTFFHCRKTRAARDQPLQLVCHMAAVRHLADVLTWHQEPSKSSSRPSREDEIFLGDTT